MWCARWIRSLFQYVTPSILLKRCFVTRIVPMFSSLMIRSWSRSLKLFVFRSCKWATAVLGVRLLENQRRHSDEPTVSTPEQGAKNGFCACSSSRYCFLTVVDIELAGLSRCESRGSRPMVFRKYDNALSKQIYGCDAVSLPVIPVCNFLLACVRGRCSSPSRDQWTAGFAREQICPPERRQQ